MTTLYCPLKSPKILYTLQRTALYINIKLGLVTRFHTSAISYYTRLAMCILDCCQLVMYKMVAYGNRAMENKMATRATLAMNTLMVPAELPAMSKEQNK